MMKFDVINILAFISASVTLYLLGKVICDFLSERRKNTLQSHNIDNDNTEYNLMKKRLMWIETAREPNHGEHYDESIYLNRAENIRKNSSFFDWVNN